MFKEVAGGHKINEEGNGRLYAPNWTCIRQKIKISEKIYLLDEINSIFNTAYKKIHGHKDTANLNTKRKKIRNT